MQGCSETELATLLSLLLLLLFLLLSFLQASHCRAKSSPPNQLKIDNIRCLQRPPVVCRSLALLQFGTIY